jgi:hypothetical protein
MSWVPRRRARGRSPAASSDPSRSATRWPPAATGIRSSSTTPRGRWPRRSCSSGRCGSWSAAAPVTDTIKHVAADGVTVTGTLDRTRLWAVQTPQLFRRAALERALAEASDEELARATDDAWLVEHSGGSVRVLGSDPGNLKITTRQDLRIAELLLAERGG